MSYSYSLRRDVFQEAILQYNLNPSVEIDFTSFTLENKNTQAIINSEDITIAHTFESKIRIDEKYTSSYDDSLNSVESDTLTAQNMHNVEEDEEMDGSFYNPDLTKRKAMSEIIVKSHPSNFDTPNLTGVRQRKSSNSHTIIAKRKRQTKIPLLQKIESNEEFKEDSVGIFLNDTINQNEKEQEIVKKRENKQKLKRFQSILTGVRRPDIVLKAILRQIRKYYKKLFYQATDYNKLLYKNPIHFYMECLDAYTTNHLQQHYELFNPANPNLKKEIMMVLGSMLKSKMMKNLNKDEESQNQIFIFSDLMYKYSQKGMEKAVQSEGFRFIISHYIEQQGELLIEGCVDDIQKEEYKKALNFLQQTTYKYFQDDGLYF